VIHLLLKPRQVESKEQLDSFKKFLIFPSHVISGLEEIASSGLTIEELIQSKLMEENM
jgi:hypothetical protein